MGQDILKWVSFPDLICKSTYRFVSKYGINLANSTVVKVRGSGGLSPLLPFEPPAIV